MLAHQTTVPTTEEPVFPATCASQKQIKKKKNQSSAVEISYFVSRAF